MFQKIRIPSPVEVMMELFIMVALVIGFIFVIVPLRMSCRIKGHVVPDSGRTEDFFYAEKDCCKRCGKEFKQ